MIIIGHEYVKYEPFYLIKKSSNIQKTPSNRTVAIQFDEQNLELMEHCRKHGISFAVICTSIQEVIFANAFEASYIICGEAVSLRAQKLADNYMYDAKILLLGKEEADLEWAAENSIDGIIFDKGLNHGSY